MWGFPEIGVPLCGGGGGGGRLKGDSILFRGIKGVPLLLRDVHASMGSRVIRGLGLRVQALGSSRLLLAVLCAVLLVAPLCD